MGVSGCGKSTIGEALSKNLNIDFFDADDFHPQSNIDKMKNGTPLNDNDRKPWLLNLAKELASWEKNKGAILACSALKESYRQLLMSQTKKIQWVYLSGTFQLIKKRMESRSEHFMKSNMLKSQFNTLEVPKYGVHIEIEKDPSVIIGEIVKKITSNTLN